MGVLAVEGGNLRRCNQRLSWRYDSKHLHTCLYVFVNAYAVNIMKVCITYAVCCNLINVNYVELHGGGASGDKLKWPTMPALAYKPYTYARSS